MSDLLENKDHAKHCAEVLKAVAHPVRLSIIATLCQGDRHVNALAEELGVSQSAISQQLRILRMHGLVAVARCNGFAHYSLAEPRLADLVRCVERCGVRGDDELDSEGGDVDGQ
jgi:DNA-binding transcriptional ArsR family regulator